MEKNNKNVLITGAAGDIGLAISRKFADMGYNLFLGFSKDESLEKINGLCREYEKCEITPLKADITDSKDVERMVGTVIEKDGKIDTVVNNAGITDDTFILRMSDESFERVLNVNLKGTFYVCRECIKHMARARSGNIINLSSVVGLHGNIAQCNYSASKAGIIGLTKSLAREYALRNIIVNAIAPGAVETRMFNKIPQDMRKNIVESIPLKRTAEPKEVAELVYFIAQSRYITGQVISIDGGMGI